jgi:molecular chaperone GrpE
MSKATSKAANIKSTNAPPGAAAAEPPAPAAPDTLAPERLEELHARAAKADEHWERLLRTAADFDNFKKRAAREKQEAIRYANEGLLLKLLPALDSFDMALAATAESPEGPDATRPLSTSPPATSDPATPATALRAGMAMVYQQLKAALTEAGLEEVDATGSEFDPNLHEAVAQHESADTPENHVVQQLRKGYKFRDRLLRPASVIVAKNPAAQPASRHGTAAAAT